MIRINKNAIVKAVAGSLGFELRKKGKHPTDFDDVAVDIIRRVTPFTMIGPDRLFSLITAVRYLERHAVPGAFVECGVWRGGALAASGLTLLSLSATERLLYLFDTFSGMSAPTDEDITFSGEPAADEFKARQTAPESADWCSAGLSEVMKNISGLGLDLKKFRFVEGMVEDTLPVQAPEEEIALLRLDTAWYKSTQHELRTLYPKLVKGGVLIIDDFGEWQGARRAVEEYFDAHDIRMLLTRVDGSVIGVKE